MAASKNSVDTSEVPLKPEAPDTLTPATTMAASGAMIEPTIVERIDYAHPAVDNEPRKGASAASNRIDFNDPTITGAEQAAINLGLDPKKANDEPVAE